MVFKQPTSYVCRTELLDASKSNSFFKAAPQELFDISPL